MFKIKGKYTSANVMIDNVEESCVTQITKMTNHPAFTNPIRIMPDTHAGKGSVIGFTMPITDKIIPNVIGVDIGCGIYSINIGNILPLSLELLEHKIRSKIPFGMNVHDRPVINFEKEFPWNETNTLLHNFSLAYNEKFNTNYYPKRKMDYREFISTCNKIGSKIARVQKSIGTLGSGNHFIEIGKDTRGNYWVTIHTGSRNFGKAICDYWQHRAIKIVRKAKQNELKNKIDVIRSEYTGMEIKDRIKKAREEVGLDQKVSNELQYIEGEEAIGYLYDMILAQKYAEFNRKIIIKIILDILGIDAIDEIETVHNYIDFRDFIIRKGAVRSYEGERFLVPFNMRDGILICDGKTNIDWNCSAPHGAGRVLSRAAAKRELNIKEFEEQMEGIYSTSVCRGTLDEAPGAYKDSKVIEDAIEPTAKVIDKIIPVMNMKDGGR